MSTVNPSPKRAPELVKTSTPGIYKRGSRYVVIWRHRGKQHKSFHRTLAEAREAKADRTGSTRSAPQSKRPFDEYARAWVASCQGRTKRGFDEDTRRSYATALEAWAIPHLGSKRICDVERKDITALVAKMQRPRVSADGRKRPPLSADSIARYMAPVRAMFGDAVEDGDLTANPALGLKINAKASRAADDAPEKVEKVKTMTRAELAAVLAAIPEQHRLVFELMANTGCRISEALGLDWGDTTFGEAPTLRICRQWYRGKLKSPKTEAGSRTVDLPPNLAAKLWALGADASGPILHTRTGQRLSDRNLTRTLDAARAKAGVPGVTHHSFRHTHGSILLDEGWTIAEVAERLGHADPAITAKVYVRKMRDRRRGLAFLDGLCIRNAEAQAGAEASVGDWPSDTICTT